jgi:hypothetical protein
VVERCLSGLHDSTEFWVFTPYDDLEVCELDAGVWVKVPLKTADDCSS